MNNAALSSSGFITVVELKKENISDVTTLNDIVAKDLEEKIDRVFLKKRTQKSYETILDDGGVIFGFYQNDELIASSCVNNALGQGRVEIKIDESLDKNKIAVFQGTMVHPKIKGLGHGIPDIALIKRMEWAFDNNKSHVFASACSSIQDPETKAYITNPKNTSGDPTKNGNWSVINGLEKKGFEPDPNTCPFNDRGLNLNIMTLGFSLPKDKDELYTHLRGVVKGDVAHIWLPRHTLKPV